MTKKNTYLYLFDEFLECFKVFDVEILHVSEVNRRVALTVRTHVLVYVVSLRLQDADAAAVEPVLTAVAADVEPAQSGERLSRGIRHQGVERSGNT